MLPATNSTPPNNQPVSVSESWKERAKKDGSQKKTP